MLGMTQKKSAPVMTDDDPLAAALQAANERFRMVREMLASHDSLLHRRGLLEADEATRAVQEAQLAWDARKGERDAAAESERQAKLQAGLALCAPYFAEVARGLTPVLKTYQQKFLPIWMAHVAPFITGGVESTPLLDIFAPNPDDPFEGRIARACAAYQWKI